MNDKPWVKWLVISVSLFMTIAVGGIFVVVEKSRQAEIERLRAERAAELRDLSTSIQTTLTRVYQNLQLRHYMAAFRILEDLAQPPDLLADQQREYQEVIFRVARGLLADRFFDEAQILFERLLNTAEYDEKARESLSEIASSYRLNSARGLLAESRLLVKQERWRDAENELRKAKLEYESVRLFGFLNVDEELKELAAYDREAKHHVHLESARWEIDDARKFINASQFEDVQTAMSKAAQHVGRAAFYKRDTDAVDQLRSELFALEAELSYRVPNLVPIWNRFNKQEKDLRTDYFFMHDYFFDLMADQSNKIRIGFDYATRAQDDQYHVVRYKIFFFNGRHFFNGHFLTSEQLKAEPNKEIHQVIYEQEIPEGFLGLAVKRIELQIYDSKNELVSRISRAFRDPSKKAQGV